MKIAYIYDAVYPFVRGGVERRIFEIATRLSARGHDVHLFGMKWWDGPDILEQDGMTLHGVCARKPFYSGGRRTTPQALHFAYSLARPLKAFASDMDGAYGDHADSRLIDCQNFPYFPCFSSRAASRRGGIPLAITWHEVWGEYWYEYMGRRGIFGRRIEQFAAGLPAHHIAVSPATAKGLDRLGIHGDIPIIPNGIDLQEIAAIPPARDSDPTDIIFAGRLIREKHVDLLIQALAMLREEHPDIRATIIGDGPERGALESLTHAQGLSDIITFTGFLPAHADVIAAMKGSKVFVLPSTREGFGIAALEAMACGLPVVTIDHPGNAAADLVQEGVTGYLCRPDAADIAEAIIRALAERDRMRESLFEFVEAYEWDAVVDMLLQRYNEILNIND